MPTTPHTRLYLSPSLSIHLARNPTSVNGIPLKLFVRDFSSARGLNHRLTEVNLADPGVTVAISHSGAGTQLTAFDPATSRLSISAATGTGTDQITITHVHPNPGGGGSSTTMSIVAEVTVHNTLHEWWFGIDSITVPRDDFSAGVVNDLDKVFHTQVVAYAHFDATPATPNVIGSIADITGHSYVALAAGNTNIEIDSTRLVGFVRGVTTGASTITGQVTGIAGTQSINANVINWYGAPSNLTIPSLVTEVNAIVDPVGAIAGNSDNFSNLLFLSEGFTADQQPLFDQMVMEIKNRMFSAPIYRPYSFLSGDFNVWKAFTPSAQRGFTNRTFRDLNVQTTPSLNASIYRNPKNALAQDTDSFFGLVNPRRTGDNIYELTEHQVGDIRRYGLHLNWHTSVMRFIGTLALRSTPADRIGRHWAGNNTGPGKDNGLVCILVNDFGSGREANYVTFTILPLILSTNVSFTFDPPRPVSGAVSNPLRWRITRDQPALTSPADIAAAITPRKIDDACDTLTHEIGHSMVLGDEYEEGESLEPGDPDHRFDNISYLDHIHFTTGTANQIDPSKLRWAALHRVERSEKIISVTWNHTDLNAITAELRIAPASVAQWPATTPVFIRELRRSNWAIGVGYAGITIFGTWISNIPRSNEDPLVVLDTISVTAGNATTGVLTISVPKAKFPAGWQALGDADFRTRVNAINLAGGLLYLPRRSSGNVVKLIDDEVLQFMTTSHLPLTTNRSGTGVCGTPSSASDSPPATVINTALRNLPTHTFKIIGAYEGGDHNTCTVYRPTGFCRMRNSSGMPDGGVTVNAASVSEFCYVCQYLIINRINPAKLVLLEANYPEFTPVAPVPPPTP